MLSHKQKQKLARRLSGKQSGHFNSPKWQVHADKVQREVERRGARNDTQA